MHGNEARDGNLISALDRTEPAAASRLERLAWSPSPITGLRLLLDCGLRWQTHRTAGLSERSPRLMARSIGSQKASIYLDRLWGLGLPCDLS
jgi:hypothetical protein